ncbi:O-antigen ligase family protein [Thermodesulfovibrio yellowstonii]|uniref:O-antigen ligase family protein n=1 Tax=Thermodesulfovibrio yellowstonii TaxID=28262 RepID=UPI0024B3A5F7|nr:O-antigen ligase family protein [Thermodesulfovibrio yellowstonii]
MQLKNYYLKITKNLDSSKFLRFFLYMLIFFQPFNGFNSFREIGFYGLIIFFIIKISRERTINIDFRDKTIVALFLLVAWSILTSILGPYPLDSLNILRKNLLVQVLIFLVIITEFKSYNELRTLFLIVVMSFIVVTIASLLENLSDLMNLKMDLYALQSKRTHKMFIGGFASNATFYLPFIAVWLAALNEPIWKKWIGKITLLLGLITVFIYNSRTSLIAIFFAFFIILLLSKKYKLLIISLTVIILSTSIAYSLKPAAFSKYKTLANFKTYISNEGLSNRFGVWQGALHIIRERPFTGYGYGWKKMAWAARDLNLEEYWKEHYPHIYAYYVDEAHLSYGRVNPHNLILQIVFEIGLIGLGIFLWFWTTIIFKILRATFSQQRSQIKDFMKYSIGILISYILINITNGYWQETYGNMIFMFTASIFVIYKQSTQRIDDGKDIQF